jgi:hypothetical protein
MAGRWFSRVVWLGIICNLALAVPTLLAPQQTMMLTRMPPASPLLWPQFSALLLILLSIFYIPAALDFARYRIAAWCTVGSRLAGVIFFVGFQPAAYHVLGYFDLVFFVPEAVLLTLAFHQLVVSPSQDGSGRSDVAPARARSIDVVPGTTSVDTHR